MSRSALVSSICLAFVAGVATTIACDGDSVAVAAEASCDSWEVSWFDMDTSQAAVDLELSDNAVEMPHSWQPNGGMKSSSVFFAARCLD